MPSHVFSQHLGDKESEYAQFRRTGSGNDKQAGRLLSIVFVTRKRAVRPSLLQLGPTLRLWAVAFGCMGVTGCLPVPLPPNDASTDAYGWKAPIEIPYGETFYRLEIPDNLAAWMEAYAVQSLAVFDANHTLQKCGQLRGASNNPLATLPQVIEGRISLFDAGACGDGPSPKICFKGQACTIPDSCSPQIVDLTGTSLEGLSTVSDILATANTDILPVACRPDMSDAARDCVASDESARNVFRLKTTRRSDAQAFIDNFGITSEAQGRPLIGASSKPESLDSNDLLVALDRIPDAVPLLTLEWKAPFAGGLMGAAKLTCFNSNGSTSDEGFNIQLDGGSVQGGPMVQTLGTACLVRSYRLTLHPAIPDLKLARLSATTFAPKPFVHSGRTQFWIEPSGAAPYSVFLEPGRNGCSAQENVFEVNKLQHVREANWPPPTGAIGTPVANERGVWMTIRANRRDVGAWIYWLALVGGTFAVALTVTLVRWAALAARSRSYSRE